ncbi:hypothetical protein FSP39_008334 [Pinctada imbricata]|uniref:ABC-type glutathione-S-conjugate transporter n=1 Tax=Pinctada imbricata TaxID=66713 RepID=A0AA88YL72_PINIB|nr:hypothetical protein FSP39_008334 [Pinctada imbricata]
MADRTLLHSMRALINESLLLDNSYPQFTKCFQDTLLVWVPCGFLWICLPFYLYSASHQRDTAPLPLSLLNISKSFVSLLLSFLMVVDLINGISNEDGEKETTAEYLGMAIKFASFALSFVIIQIERVKGNITSGILFLFYLLSMLAGIVPFYTYIIQKVYDSDLNRFVLFYIYWGFLFLQVVLLSVAESRGRRGYHELGHGMQCPETNASFLSRITFWWCNSLIQTGFKKDLEEDDVWELHPRDCSDNVVPPFEESWNNEVKQQAKSLEHSISYNHRPHQSHNVQATLSEKSPLLGGAGKSYTHTPEVTFKGSKVRGENKASLFKVMVKTYGPDILKAWGCKFIYDLLQFVSPQLLSVLIEYVTMKQLGKEEYEWKGYVYAAGFFIVALLQSTFFHQNFHYGMTLGMRIKSAVITAVYKKALTMNNEARKSSTVGEIVNLMSVDCQRMQDLTGYLWMVWSSPMQIILATWLLWNQVGAAVFAGLGVMVLLIPLNAVISIIQRRLQVKLMKFKDTRIKLMNEVLNGMKVTLVTFITYVLTSETGYLDAQKAFVSLSLLNILRFPINILPMMISYLIQANVSIGRISKFIKYGDLDPDNVQHDDRGGELFIKYNDLDPDNVRHDDRGDKVVEVNSATFSWDENLQPALQNIDFEIKRGKLVAVVGQVGSGKSSLVSALLGEMDKLSGSVNVKGSIAYVPQQAWIQNATVQDNILFGKVMNQCKYDDVLEACALGPDLEILSAGDMTEIGEKGINLSGGQKQRVSLARAVYNNADIYLMDDPLSAVDSHVGKHIFQKVMGEKGLLKNKTRILVTHGIHWLPMVDMVVVLQDGKISEMGTYDELLSHDGAFAQFLKTYLTQDNDEEQEEDEEIEQIRSKILERVESVTSDTAATSGDEAKIRKRTPKKKPPLERTISTIDGRECKPDKAKQKQEKDVLIQAEKAEKGKVAWKVFMIYFKAIGLATSAIILFVYMIYQALGMASNIWLSEWTDDKDLKNISNADTSDYQNKNYMYLGVYAALGLSMGIIVMVWSLVCTLSQVRASASLHYDMLANMMKSPMSFFDTTPIGRIVNRFSRDVETLDSILPTAIRMWMNTSFAALSTVIVISYSTPIFLSVIVPIAIFYYLVQRYYVPTSRQLQRLESTTRSPIYNHFSETLMGASSIRAYNQQDRFIRESLDRVDKNLKYYFARISSNRWLGWRLELAGNLVVFAAAMFAVLSPDISGSLVGLSVSYALQITSALNMLVRQTADMETYVVSVERMKEYSETETEAEWVRSFKRPPHDWPQRGYVSFHDYKTRYREGLDLVLRGITCEIQGGEKVGIVGRTGAGKSSLTVALFRLIEAAGGEIIIDGQRIADMGLHDLRNKLTILPQDPVLFAGSLRMNMDPFDLYTDQQIWEALEHSHLKKFVSELPDGLSHECGEGGQNLSVGQRQLVCLARTLLRKTKILILDEATAAVDMETDDLIQNTIRREFKDCTILTIAHRLNTIMDYDKVMVLDQGLVSEYDSPNNLLKNKNSAFFSMAKDANLV